MSRFFNCLIFLLLMHVSIVSADDQLFRSLDKNADNKISPHEIDPPQKAFFDRAIRIADTNRDGELSASELQAALTPQTPSDPASTTAAAGRRNSAGNRPNFRLLDRNQDGMLSLQEVPQMFKQRLQQILKRTGKESITIEALESMTANASTIGPDSQPLRGTTNDSRPNPASNTSQSRDSATPRDIAKPRTTKMSGTTEMSGTTGPAGTGQAATRPPNEPMQSTTAPSNRLRLMSEIPARLIRNFDRIDANKDGGLDRAEIMKAFSEVEKLPANRQ